MAEMVETSNFDEFKGTDCVFVADWLKIKGPHKLCSVFEGVFILYKYVLSNKPCLHAQLQKHNKSY